MPLNLDYKQFSLAVNGIAFILSLSDIKYRTNSKIQVYLQFLIDKGA